MTIRTLGEDPQPAHMSEIYEGPNDKGGVHINSGIPNRAFVLTAQALGGNAWDIAGCIWYKTMLALPSDSQFINCANMTAQGCHSRLRDSSGGSGQG